MNRMRWFSSRMASDVLLISVGLSVIGCGLLGDNTTRLRIEGQVVAENGNAISGASVELTKTGFSSENLASTTSNEDGEYRIGFEVEGRCPESLFVLTASRPGFHSAYYQGMRYPSLPRVRCTEETLTLNFELIPCDGADPCGPLLAGQP